MGVCVGGVVCVFNYKKKRARNNTVWNSSSLRISLREIILLFFLSIVSFQLISEDKQCSVDQFRMVSLNQLKGAFFSSKLRGIPIGISNLELKYESIETNESIDTKYLKVNQLLFLLVSSLPIWQPIKEITLQGDV